MFSCSLLRPGVKQRDRNVHFQCFFQSSARGTQPLKPAEVRSVQDLTTSQWTETFTKNSESGEFELGHLLVSGSGQPAFSTNMPRCLNPKLSRLFSAGVDKRRKRNTARLCQDETDLCDGSGSAHCEEEIRSALDTQTTCITRTLRSSCSPVAQKVERQDRGEDTAHFVCFWRFPLDTNGELHAKHVPTPWSRTQNMEEIGGGGLRIWSIGPWIHNPIEPH